MGQGYITEMPERHRRAVRLFHRRPLVRREGEPLGLEVFPVWPLLIHLGLDFLVFRLPDRQHRRVMAARLAQILSTVGGRESPFGVHDAHLFSVPDVARRGGDLSLLVFRCRSGLMDIFNTF